MIKFWYFQFCFIRGAFETKSPVVKTFLSFCPDEHWLLCVFLNPSAKGQRNSVTKMRDLGFD